MRFRFGKVALFAALAVALLCAGAWAQQAATIPDPVAKVNGQPISREVFIQRLQAYHGVYVLENLLAEYLLEAEAKKRGVTVTEQEITQKLEELKKREGILTPESFRSWLLANEWTENRYRDKARLIVLIEKTFAREASVADTDVERYYNENKARFTIHASARMWILQTRTEDLAQRALQLIKAGKDFPTAAKELGAGMAQATPEAMNIPVDGLPVALRLAIERSPLGQPVGPVKINQNPQDTNSPAVAYEIVKVEAREPERIRLFSEVKEEIRQTLFNDRLFGTFGIFNRWLEEERQRAAIERFITITGEPSPQTTGTARPAAPPTR